MNYVLLLVAILFTSINLNASECQSILKIETDDSRIYTEEGEVFLCFTGDKISSVKIVKPVKPYRSSSQHDERFPVLNIFLNQVAGHYSATVLKPKRFGVEVAALYLHVNESQFNEKTGGVFKLSYLSNYVTQKYKSTRFKVAKMKNSWKLYVQNRNHYKPIDHLFVETKFTGVKSFRFNYSK